MATESVNTFDNNKFAVYSVVKDLVKQSIELAREEDSESNQPGDDYINNILAGTIAKKVSGFGA